MISKTSSYDVLIIGASGGLGKALAERLRQQPDIRRLHLTSRCQPADTTSPPDAALPAQYHYQLDITDEDSVSRFIEQLDEHAPHLRLVINTAGILHGDGFAPERRLQDIRLADMQRLMTTNSIGHAVVMAALLPLLPRHGRVVLASLSARVGSISDNRLGGWYSYRASKAALNQIIRSAAIELRRYNPDSICVGLHPGTVDTGLSAPFQQNVPAEQLFSTQQSADYLLQVLHNRQPADSGQIFAWDGQAIAA